MKVFFVISVYLLTQLSLKSQTESFWYHNDGKDSCPVVYFCPEYEYDFYGMSFVWYKTGHRLIIDTIKFEPIDSAMIWFIEQQLPTQLAILNKKEKKFQNNGCPDIEINLYKYSRQYFSYINKFGEHEILINFFMMRGFLTSPVYVFDGCSYYWTIRYCVKEKLFYSLLINGRA